MYNKLSFIIFRQNNQDTCFTFSAQQMALTQISLSGSRHRSPWEASWAAAPVTEKHQTRHVRPEISYIRFF